MTADSERGEKLEERVDELEATVRGLTEELVDASERIRVLDCVRRSCRSATRQPRRSSWYTSRRRVFLPASGARSTPNPKPTAPPRSAPTPPATAK
jgi:hypothetical protein